MAQRTDHVPFFVRIRGLHHRHIRGDIANGAEVSVSYKWPGSFPTKKPVNNAAPIRPPLHRCQPKSQGQNKMAVRRPTPLAAA